MLVSVCYLELCTLNLFWANSHNPSLDLHNSLLYQTGQQSEVGVEVMKAMAAL